MPRQEDIEAFNQELIKLGNEPNIARQRGELIEAPLSPEAYPVDHNGPLAKVRKPAQSSTPQELSTKSDPESEPLGTSFDDLFGNTDDADATPIPEAPQEAENPFGDLFDDSLFPSLEEPEEPGIDTMDNKTDSNSDADEEAEGGFNLGDPFADLDNPFGDEDHENTPIPGPSTELDNVFEDEDGFQVEDSEASRDMDSFLDNFDPMAGMDLDDGFIDTPSTPEAEDLPTSTDEAPLSLGDDIDEAFDFNDIGSDATSDIPSTEETKDPFDFGFDDLGSTEEVSDAPPSPDMDQDSTDNLFGGNDFGTDDFGSFDLGPADEPEEVPSAPDELGSFEAAPTETSDFGAGSMPDFATDLDADFGTDDFPEEFSMGDFDKEFGVLDEVKAKDDWSMPSMGKIDEAVEEVKAATAADEAKDYQISADDYKLIRESLSAMPLNLRIATEEVLGDPKKPFAEIKAIIDLLIAGESPSTIAPLVSKLLGKKIKVPAGYTHKTGRAFEEEKNSFAWRFRENILPVLRTITLAGAGLAVLILLGYNFVYIPLRANSLYDQGITAIKAGEYDQGKSLFQEAYGLWPVNDRYVQYAETYTEMKQNTRAHGFYKELLGDLDPRVLPPNLPDTIREFELNTRYQRILNGQLAFVRGKEPMHRVGILSFAGFLAGPWAPEVGKFEKKYEDAIYYLERLLQKQPWDREAMILQGDIFMDWALYLDDPRLADPAANILSESVIYTAEPVLLANQRLNPAQAARSKDLLDRIAELHEGARFNYARLIETQGNDDLLKSKMLRYFMRSGKKVQAEEIAQEFLANENLKADPEVIAELADTLITQAHGDLRMLDKVHIMIKRTLKTGAQNASLYYQLARFYRYLNDGINEEDVLKNTLLAFRNEEELAPFSRFRLQQYIDTLIRAGENALHLEKALSAQDLLNEAKTRYEEAILTRKIPARAATFGRLYARLGDVAYYQKDTVNRLNVQYLDEARELYIKAQENQYGVNPLLVSLNRPYPDEEEVWNAFQDISYKLGYINYNLARVDGKSPQVRDILLQQASFQFINAQGRVTSENINLRMALGNTFTEIGNHEAAVGQYRVLYQKILDLRRGVGPIDPDNRPSHKELIEMQFAVANNLGVALYRLYRTGGLRSEEVLGQAQYYLSEATTIGQNIDRDAETGIRAETIRLAFLNIDRALSPIPRDDVYIIPEIKPDLSLGLLGTL